MVVSARGSIRWRGFVATALGAGAVWLIGAGLGACADVAPEGSEHGACYARSNCDPGLVCTAGSCEKPGADRVAVNVVLEGDGAGTVTSEPAGIDCGQTCSASFAVDSDARFTATTAGWDYFDGWGGDCAGRPETGCAGRLRGSIELTAGFRWPSIAVALSGTGTGVVTSSPPGIDCGDRCEATFAVGTPVTLTAISDGGWFTGWGGECSGVGDCTVTMDRVHSVTAEFEVPPPTCDSPLPCPPPNQDPPSNLRITRCGQLFDLETNQPLREDGATGSPCTEPSSTGPCAVRLRLFDMLGYAANPAGALPQHADDITVDTCGRFRIIDATRSFNNCDGIVTDDATGAGDYVLTATTYSRSWGGYFSGCDYDDDIIDSSGRGANLVAWVTRRATDRAWTDSMIASLPVGVPDPLDGATFGERGVDVRVFQREDTPVPGVTVTHDGAAVPDDDFYFSGAADRRTQVDSSAMSTGANGTALIISSTLFSRHSGTGALPALCEWPENLLAAVPGLIWIEATRARIAGTDDLCPP